MYSADVTGACIEASPVDTGRLPSMGRWSCFRPSVLEASPSPSLAKVVRPLSIRPPPMHALITFLDMLRVLPSDRPSQTTRPPTVLEASHERKVAHVQAGIRSYRSPAIGVQRAEYLTSLIE